MNDVSCFFVCLVTFFVENWAFDYFLIDFIYLFLERGEGREKETEKHQCVVASHTPPLPLGTWPANPGMCPDWESNWQPLGSQASSTQSTEPHQPGPFYCYNVILEMRLSSS